MNKRKSIVNYNFKTDIKRVIDRENGVVDSLLENFIKDNFGYFTKPKSINETVSRNYILVVDDRDIKSTVTSYFVGNCMPYIKDHECGIWITEGGFKEHSLRDSFLDDKSYKTISMNDQLLINERKIIIGNVYKVHGN